MIYNVGFSCNSVHQQSFTSSPGCAENDILDFALLEPDEVIS